MGYSEEAPREPCQDSFAAENVVAPAISVPQQAVYIHGYVMSSEPPRGPPRVYDVKDIENNRPATTNTSFVTSSPRKSCQRGPGAHSRQMVLVGYVLAYFSFIPHIISIAGSLHMISKGKIIKHRATVLVLSFLEIAAISLCLFSSWSFTYNSWTVNYTHGKHSNNFDSSSSYEVESFYFGWVYIVLWFLVLVAVGTPRVVYSLRAQEVVHNTVNDEVLSEKRGKHLRRSALILYILGIMFAPLQISSIACSLTLLSRGYITSKRSGLLACAALELCGWVIGASLSWTSFQNCYDYENTSHINDSYYYCDTVWIGWIFLIVRFAVAVACGIPRVVMTYRGCNRNPYVQIQ